MYQWTHTSDYTVTLWGLACLFTATKRLVDQTLEVLRVTEGSSLDMNKVCKALIKHLAKKFCGRCLLEVCHIITGSSCGQNHHQVKEFSARISKENSPFMERNVPACGFLCRYTPHRFSNDSHPIKGAHHQLQVEEACSIAAVRGLWGYTDSVNTVCL